MTAKRPDLPSHPVWPTVLILAACATAAVVASVLLTFFGNALAISLTSGPFGWIAYGPALMAKYTQLANLSLIATPIWALLAGSFFANRASGNSGSAAADMNVTFFSETHEISRVTQRLAESLGLKPIAYIGWFPNEDINAFAMGTTEKNTLIAVSKGAIERLSKRELIAVLAHELGHVASRDMARMTYARGVQNGLTFFLIFQGLKNAARWIFTPLSELEILRLSRAREFTADRISAMMVGPEHMIAALEKLLQEEKRPRTNGYANVMMWSGFGGGHLFSTHPPLEKRIARLKEFPAASRSSPAPAANSFPSIAE